MKTAATGGGRGCDGARTGDIAGGGLLAGGVGVAKKSVKAANGKTWLWRQARSGLL
jgi:hypothetical protein